MIKLLFSQTMYLPTKPLWMECKKLSELRTNLYDMEIVQSIVPQISGGEVT
jgi:hypothetical protein